MKLHADVVENLRAPSCQHQALDVGTYSKIQKVDTALGNHAHKASESGFGPQRKKKIFVPLSKGRTGQKSLR